MRIETHLNNHRETERQREREREMKGPSKVIMGATLVMVVSIAIVLGLVLVLLAELYCSFLLRRRRQLQASNSNTPTATAAVTINDASQKHDQDHSGAPSLSSFYAQGVIHAPRSFLFPAVYGDQSNRDLEKQYPEFPEFCESPAQHPSSSRHDFHQHVFSLPSSPSFIPLAPPKLVHENPIHCSTITRTDEVCDGSTEETYIYICNPIYENDDSRPSRVETPFETPDSSPSRLETNGSSGESPTSSPSSHQTTPPLTPMKKLPAEACSVSLKDAHSLANSGSDSNIEGISSSSTSGSPCTSPSW